jgi:uncharacterized membrane protein YraQ (UPF0718 family)
MFNKTKYRIVFVRKEYNTMNAVFIKTMKIPVEKIKMGNKCYIIDYSNPFYNVKNKKVYFINIDTGNQMIFDEIKKEVNPLELDNIIGNNLITQLTKGVMDNTKEKIITIFIGILIGGLIGYIIATSIMQNKIDELYQSMQIIDLGVLKNV